MSRDYKIIPEYCWTVDDTRFNFRLFIFEDEDISYATEITNIDRNYQREYNKRTYQKDKENDNFKKQNPEYSKEYYYKNRDKILVCKKEYYQENIDDKRAYNIKYNKTHQEIRKKYHEEHKVEKKENFKKWYNNNPNYKNEWRKNNPEKRRLYDLKKKELRKDWGIEPINDYFKGAHLHHLHIDGNHAVGIYIPADLHMSIPHRYDNQDSMNKINKESIKWYK